MIVENTMNAWDKRLVNGDYDYLRRADVHLPIIEQVKRLDVKTLLDVGCYTGNFLAYAVAQGMVFDRYLGIDYSQKAIQEASALKVDSPWAAFDVADWETYTPVQAHDCILVSGLCCYYQHDRMVLQFLRRAECKYLIVQDVQRAKDLYPNLVRQYPVLHEEYYTIGGTTRNSRRRMVVLQIQG